MATIGNVCGICGEEVVGSMQVHFMSKCKGYGHQTTQLSEGTKEGMATHLPSNTVKVRFSWTPVSGMSFKNVTLLSAFNSVELISNGIHYTSNPTDVPVGEYDGQLVIGSNYCYPLKKFIVEHDGEMIQLELDVRNMETQEDTTYTYDTSYPATTQSTITYSDPTIKVKFNPAYQIQDQSAGVGGSETYSGSARAGEGGQKVYAYIFYPTNQDSEELYSPTTTYLTPTTTKSITQKQRVLSESPSSSDTEATPTDSEEFSRQLSAEGFSPAKVKSKVPTGSSSKSSHIHVHPKQASTTSSSTLPTSTLPKSSVTKHHPPVTTASSKTGQTSETSFAKQNRSIATTGNTGFSVTDIQGSSEVDVITLQEENKRLQTNLERVSAQWEGRVRRLEGKLKQYESGKEPSEVLSSDAASDERLTELEETIEKLHSDLEAKDSDLDTKERELVECKDRITALENQLVEYATMMNDQSKVIRQSHQQTHHYTKIEELYQNSVEFTKKQQIEFQEKLSTFETTLNRLSKLEEENKTLHQISNQLSSEIEEYRKQARVLVQDLEKKTREVEIIRERLLRTEKSRSVSELEALEIETVKQKCEGWKERADQLSSELDSVQALLEQTQRDKQFIEQSLNHRLELVTMESNARQLKIEDGQKQLKDLQDLRVKMETDLSGLRSERTQTLERNAQLLEACDPEKYAKLQKEVGSLSNKLKEKEKEISKLQESLRFHSEGSRELQQHLDAALNEKTLQQIESRIDKYKKERDTAKENLKQLKISYEERLQHLQTQHDAAMVELQNSLKQKEEDIVALMTKAEEYKAKRQKYREINRRLEQERDDLALELHQKDEIIDSLHQRVQYLEDEEDHAHNEGYTGGYSDQDHLNDDYKQGSGSDDREVELHVPYVLSDSLTRTKPKSFSHFSMGSTHSLPPMIPNISTTQDSSEVLPLSGDPVLPTTSHMTSTLSLSSDKPHLPREKTERATTQVLTAKGTPPPTKPIKISSLPRGGTSDIGTKVPKGTKLSVTVRTGQGEILTYVKPALPHQVNIGDSIIVKRRDGTYDAGVIRCVGVQWKGDEMCGVELEVPRQDGQGKNNDGTFKDGKKYFECSKGYGLYTPVSNIHLYVQQ